MNKISNKLLLSSLIAAVMTGCGGAAVDSGNNQSGGSAQEKTTVIEAVGEIDGFGSVIVNGERYNTDDAVVMVDGEAASEDDLDTGMMVEVEGEEDAKGNKKAKTVKFRSIIAGELESLDAEARTLTIMGTSILIDADTKLDDNIDEMTLAPLAVGSSVRVSGYKYGNNASEIVALRVDVQDSSKPSRLYGAISNLNLETSTFSIDGKSVDFSGANVDGIDRDLAEGDKVMVKGKVEASTLLAKGTLKVVTKNLGDKTQKGRQKKVDIKGLIKRDNNGNITVNGKKLTGLDRAKWAHGDKSELTDGTRVEVDGMEKEAGEIVVEKIEVEKAATIRIMATIEAIDSDAPSITLNETVYTLTDETDFHDTGINKVRRFNLDNLALDDKIVINAFENDEGQKVAKRIIRLHDDGQVRSAGRRGLLHTTLDSIDGSTLMTTGGIKVMVNDKTHIANSVDLTMISTGEDGDKLQIAGVYQSEDTLVAVTIKTLRYAPKKGHEPRDSKDPKKNARDLKNKVNEASMRMDNKESLDEKTKKDVEGHLQTIKDRIADRKADLNESDKEELKETLQQMKEKMAGKARLKTEDREELITLIDKIIAKLSAQGVEITDDKIDLIKDRLAAVESQIGTIGRLKGEEFSSFEEALEDVAVSVERDAASFSETDKLSLQQRIDLWYARVEAANIEDPDLKARILAKIAKMVEALATNSTKNTSTPESESFELIKVKLEKVVGQTGSINGGAEAFEEALEDVTVSVERNAASFTETHKLSLQQRIDLWYARVEAANIEDPDLKARILAKIAKMVEALSI